jgi:hypothetical protein
MGLTEEANEYDFWYSYYFNYSSGGVYGSNGNHHRVFKANSLFCGHQKQQSFSHVKLGGRVSFLPLNVCIGDPGSKLHIFPVVRGDHRIFKHRIQVHRIETLDQEVNERKMTSCGKQGKTGEKAGSFFSHSGLSYCWLLK